MKSGKFDTPIDFASDILIDKYHIQYIDLHEIAQGSPWIGYLSINGNIINGYRFGGPFLLEDPYLYIPALQRSSFIIVRIDLNSNELVSIGKLRDYICLEKIENNKIYFYDSFTFSSLKIFDMNNYKKSSKTDSLVHLKEWNLISFYDEDIRFLIKQVDAILNKLDQQSLLINPDYSFDELSCESYLKLNFKRQDSVSFYLVFTNSEIEIGVDRIVEAVFFEKKSVENSPNVLNEWITLLYTSYIRVDYFGKADIYVTFLDEKDTRLRYIKSWGTLLGPLHSFFSRRRSVRYSPIYKMDDNIFFKYYIPALKEALLHTYENADFSAKDPSWYYPKNMTNVLMLFEDSHYEEYPILEKVAYYFHAIEHNFPSFEGIDINDYKQMILDEMEGLEKEFLIEYSYCNN